MTVSASGNPEFIGKYEIDRPLGSGSMGVVYRATDPEIGRVVAIKTLRNVFLGDDPSSEAMQRFRQESRSAGKLRHPNIVTVFEAGRTETGSPYIVMEFIDGESLEDLIKSRAPLDPLEALHYLGQVGSAIDYAHSQGVIHRDIKPSNVILDLRQHPYLLDFGVAKLSDTSLTPAGMVVGTPSYMAPEQIRGETLDGGTDRFAFGVVAFELFTGVRPFPGTDFTTVVSNIIHNPPFGFADAGAQHLPKELERVLHRGVSKARQDRYPSCLEFVAELGKALGAMADSSGVSGYRAGQKWVNPAPTNGAAAARVAESPVSPKAVLNVATGKSDTSAPMTDSSAVATQLSAGTPFTGASTSASAASSQSGASLQGAPVKPISQNPAPTQATSPVTPQDVARAAAQKNAPVVDEWKKDAPRAGSSAPIFALLGGAILLAGGAGWYFTLGPGKGGDQNEVTEVASANEEESEVSATPLVQPTASREVAPVQAATTAPTQSAAIADEMRKDTSPSNTEVVPAIGAGSEIELDRLRTAFGDSSADPKVLITTIQQASPAVLENLVPELLKLSRHPDYTVRIAVLKSLVGGEKFKSKEVLRALVESLDDPEFLVRGFAARTIASLNNQAALKLLERRLGVETNDVVKKVLVDAIAKLHEGGVS